jgi:hypothetical protein
MEKIVYALIFAGSIAGTVWVVVYPEAEARAKHGIDLASLFGVTIPASDKDIDVTKKVQSPRISTVVITIPDDLEIPGATTFTFIDFHNPEVITVAALH